MAPLWQRALESRQLAKEASLRRRLVEAGRKGGFAAHLGRGRKHPEMKVGDDFGSWKVVAIIGRGYRGRSDLRVEIRCACGARSEVYEYQARRRATTSPSCDHPRHRGRP